MTRPRNPPRRADVATHFRGEIEKADAQGVPRGDMALHLTLSDVSHLKRDRGVALSDIRFVDGTMFYLDVRIEQGGVTESKLRLP